MKGHGWWNHLTCALYKMCKSILEKYIYYIVNEKKG